MTGFVPPHYAPLSEVRDEVGSERTGQLLSAGSFRAFVQDAGGRLIPIDPGQWAKPGAREVLEDGEMPPSDGGRVGWGGMFLRPEDGKRPLYVAVADHIGQLAILTAMQRRQAEEGNPDGKPPSVVASWSPDIDETLTSWLDRPEVISEAERRLKSAGVPLSEKRLEAALEVMWRATGGSVAEGTIGRIRRRT